jgi:hypothetical protein
VTVEQAEQVSVLPGQVPASRLAPGRVADLSVRISNPNSFGVQVPSLTLDSTRGAGGFEVMKPGCEPDLSFQDQTGDWSIPAGGVLQLDLPGAVRMGRDASDACQGATFVVYLTASA